MNNYWMALPVAIKASVKNYISDPDTYVPGEEASKMRRTAALLADFRGTSHLFNRYQSKDLYNFYGEPEDIDEIIADFPQAIVLGSWDMDGNIISPTDPDTLEYMPDVPELIEGEVVYNKATELAQVNMLAGQAPRSFN